MDSWMKYSISKVVCHVEKGEHNEARPYCPSAKEYFDKTILNKIRIGDNSKILPVHKFIDDVAHSRVMKKGDVDEAILLFHKYIKPFLEEEERKNAGGSNTKGTNHAPYTERKSDENVVERKDGTKKPLERGVDELVLAFRNLHLNGACEGVFKRLLTITNNSEKLSYECLLQIVKKSFEINRQEAELQLSTAEECAKQIVRNGKLSPGECPKGARNSANELLRRYRYLHADLATERLKGAIVQEVKKMLFNEYNIQFKGDSSLEMFTRECAEVTWLMSVEDPPINMVHEDNVETVDRKNYEIVGGKSYKAILWPALKQEGYEKTLAKGMLCSQE